jgi:uncharacterized membrane protein YfcA
VSHLVVFAVAFLASGLTFFSGFGLGTLLLPAFALLFPVERAVALTAVVHFLNGLFKLMLVARHAEMRVVLRFGVPAIVAAAAGAWLLVWLSDIPPLFSYKLLGSDVRVLPVKVAVGALLLIFALGELLPSFRRISFGREYLALGGVLSGFFGGLSGMQGALRSAFLARAGLSKEGFVATGVVVACFIDISRLSMYWQALMTQAVDVDYGLLAGAVLSAFVGAFVGNRLLGHVTMRGIRGIVATMLFFVAIALVAGIL